jgi:SpoVK/Ycf46/Vps4 family AAA+-type ATPase
VSAFKYVLLHTDEMDSLMEARGDDTSGAMRKIVNELLVQMGKQPHGVLVLGELTALSL